MGFSHMLQDCLLYKCFVSKVHTVMAKYIDTLLSLWKMENTLQKTCHNLHDEILKCVIVALALSLSLSLPVLELHQHC